MLIAVLVGIMVAVVVGVNLLPKIVETIDAIPEEDISTETSALLDILPIILVVVVLLGAIAWIGGCVGGENTSTGKTRWSTWRDARGGKKAIDSLDLLDRTYSLSEHERQDSDESFSLIEEKRQEADIVVKSPDEKTSWRSRGHVG